MITDEASVRAMKPMRIFSPLPLGVSVEAWASAGLAGLASLLPPPPQAGSIAAAAALEPVTPTSLRKVRRSNWGPPCSVAIHEGWGRGISCLFRKLNAAVNVGCRRRYKKAALRSQENL